MPRPYREIPEPRRPDRWGRVGRALGHLPEWVGLFHAEDVLGRMLRYAEECGPMARVSLGPMRLVVVSDAGLAAQLLSDRRANHKGASYILTRAVLDNVLLLNGAAWEHHRALYKKALKGADPVPVAREVTRQAVMRWMADPDRDAFDRDVFRLVGDVAARFIAGVTIDETFEPHRHLVQYELAAIGIDLVCQPWTLLSPARYLRMRRSVTEARRFFGRAVEERLRRPDPSARDVLDGFVRLAEAGGYPRTVDAIQEGVVNFFFTAHDVLASSVTWTLHLLAQHPAEQTRLREALRSGGGEGELERVVKEGLRLFPGYGLFGRTVLEDLELGGHWIPAGTLVIVSPFVTHRLDRHFDEAARFVPDRWQGKPGAPQATAKDHYLPFGSGARACLASHLAFPLVTAIVREVVTSVELTAEGPAPSLRYWGTTYPRERMRVRTTAPQASSASLSS